ncbi:MAG: hypothetical protein HC932_00195 [Thermales bacterium]|nr:hypothetical protein [Thermales bacterium]
MKSSKGNQIKFNGGGYAMIKNNANILINFYLKDVRKNVKKIRNNNSNKKYFTLFAGVFLLVPILFSILNFSLQINTPVNENINQSSAGQFSDDQKVLTSTTLLQLKPVIKFFEPIFNDFLTQTPDITGNTNKEGDSYSIRFGNNQDTIKHSDSLSFPSPKKFTNLLKTSLFGLIWIIFMVRFLSVVVHPESKGNMYEIFIDFLKLSVLILSFEYMLSLSILFINLINKLVLGDASFSNFLIDVIDRINSGFGLEFKDYIDTITGSFLNPLTGGAFSFLSVLPLYLGILGIIICLLIIILQMIFRFIYLYILFVLYPAILPFYFLPSTRGVFNSYTKIWTTNLIHQPVLLLGLSVVINFIEIYLSGGGGGLHLIYLVLGMFVALLSINVLVGKLWGDAYTAIGQNFQVGGVISSAIKGVSMTSKLSRMGSRRFQPPRSPIKEGGNISSKVAKGFSDVTRIKKQKMEHKDLVKQDASSFGSALKSSGLDVGVSPKQGRGILGVQGEMYVDKTAKGNIMEGFLSQQDAIDSGISKKNISKINSSVPLLDTSNYKALQNYNLETAKNQKRSGEGKNLHLTRSSTIDRITSSMELNKDYITNLGAGGIITARYPKNKGKNYPKQIVRTYIFRSNKKIYETIKSIQS